MKLLAVLTIVGVAVVCIPALASNPGEPLDCADWVILQPGVTCISVIDYPCNNEYTTSCAMGLFEQIGAEGHIYGTVGGSHPLGLTCGGQVMNRYELWKFDGQTEQVVAYLDQRCLVDNPRTFESLTIHGLLASPTDGRLYLSGQAVCITSGNPSLCPYGSTFGSPRTLLAFIGFPSTFDILQTYTPPPGPLSFRVPAHPEGLEQADHFDTYTGNVADLPDFSKATAMACDYPATPPSVGDYLTISDTSSTPAPGQPTYIVTAVDDGAERRIGRQQVGGVKSGRDPAALPGCP